MQGQINFNPSFMAGFTLAAYQRPDGTLVSTAGAVIQGWPDSIMIEDTTFTLEEVHFVGREGDPKGRFMNAEYV